MVNPDDGKVCLMKVPFRVISEFRATAAISGDDHQFEPGDVVVSELRQCEETVEIEVDGRVYLVSRPTFDDCCITNYAGPDALP